MLAALAASCVSRPDLDAEGRLRAHIAEDIALTLPMPPGYPETITAAQIVQAQYGEAGGVFEAVLSLSPEQAVIVVTAVGGPRLATVTWDADGVREERTVLAPGGVPVENLLADIFMVRWPEAAVADALPEGVSVVSGEDGSRRIVSDGETIVEIIPDAANPGRTLVRNLSFGYEVTIIDQAVG